MTYYAFIKNNEIIGVGECPCSGDGLTAVEITKKTFGNIDHYKWDGSNVVLNTHYEEEQAEKERQRFLKDFFNTSLGWVRRAVHMKDGSIKDFLSDILPLIQPGVPIITYNIDGTQNLNVLVTEEFINECKQQVLIDFYGAQNDV